MNFRLFIFSFLLVLCFNGFAQSNNLFEKGNDYYNDGKFVEAIEEYEKVLENNEHSADLYFNLANAHYKLNNVAPSIYYYEKALLLKPNDKDIKNNLVFARNMTIDDIGVSPEVGFRKMLNDFTSIFTYEKWSILAVSLMLIFTVLLIVYFFSQTTTRKRFMFISSLSILFLALLSLAMAYNGYNLYINDKPAIVYVQESQVKTEPNLRGALAFTLHEGTKVQIVDTIDDWKQIRLSDGTTGWIEGENLKMLKETE